MKKLFTILFLLITVSAFAGGPKNQYVRIKTTYGECIIRLYNETPQHRDNFIKLTKQGFYNGTLFHRVITALDHKLGNDAVEGRACKYLLQLRFTINLI